MVAILANITNDRKGSMEASALILAAGSVITKDVSAGALGLGRARQTEIEGWNEKKKKSQ